jgi:hypothetical protein
LRAQRKLGPLFIFGAGNPADTHKLGLVAFPALSMELLQALHSGLEGAAVLSPQGEPIELAGTLDRHEVRALAALVSRQGPPGILDKLFAGELVSATLDGTEFRRELVTSTLDRDDPAYAASLELVPPTLGVRPGALDRAPDRTVYLGIAGRCVFVVAIAGPDAIAATQAMGDLCRAIDAIVRDARGSSRDPWQPPPAGAGGGGSPPAEAFVFLPPRDASRKPN